jgi:hypothetical protein
MAGWARRRVAKDHSCLFTALIYLVNGPDALNSTTDRLAAVTALRKYCADTVVADAETWPEWKLGHEPAAYAKWIQKSDTWGGEIELFILAERLQVEVLVVDMVTQSILSYGTATAAKGRVHLLYTGQLALRPDRVRRRGDLCGSRSGFHSHCRRC